MPSVLLHVVALALTYAVSSPQTPGGTLVLRNTRWEQVRIEVRLGPATDCMTNPSVGTRTLKRDQHWTIVTKQPICWRREEVPGDATRGWTGWTRASVAAATKQEVVL